MTSGIPSGPARSKSGRPARPHRRVIIAGAAVLALFGVGLSITAAVNNGSATGGPHDLHGNAVRLDPGTLPDASIRKQMDATADDGGRITVPSVGLDAPIGAVTAVNGILTPPGFTSVYAVRNVGARITSPDSGTVYLVTHSLRGGGVAPGNFLIDVEDGTAAVHRGDAITVAGTKYAVTDTASIAKPEIGEDADLWSSIPDRLVIITCLQLPSGKPSTHNLVIIATKQ